MATPNPEYVEVGHPSGERQAVDSADEQVEIEELGLRAPEWCMYHRDTGQHKFSEAGKCRGCGAKGAN